ncbi:hypothetical protein AV530_008304 [Patagioenas fasciata monilis]|uniref:Cadherin domain-containing protein n=1 Tax=Patagioenas fasciata monilis TaxID=372326 RepID=A0A1V4KUZ5_PATFA|nr:hypothetical protein AV530_008304 [Patagioenas fasciata monilis]
MAIARQVLCLSAFLSLVHGRSELLRYSVAEEGESGSVVANVAEDAGLAPAQLSARRARLASEDGRQHFRLERGTGRLVVAERLDREELCGQDATCTLPFELVLVNPLQFLRVEVTVEDINDHAPVFPEEQVTFKIPETSNPGSRFPLEGAQDLDIGSNSIQAYSISPENVYFNVSFGIRSNGDKYVELVLEKPLDREEESEMGFRLIAIDGGSPPVSGTTQIHVIVLDVNDNAPVFTQDRYVGKVLENAPEGSVVLRVVATDLDVGPNGNVSYRFSQAVSQSDSAFVIDHVSGEIKLSKPLDFEAAERYELSVQATDGGGLSAICKVLVEVVDVNDNAPELVVSTFNTPLPENALPGTVVAILNVKDRDAGVNGKISCALEDQLSFSLRQAYKNYYELVTVSALDREETAQYILSVTAADAGSPPLTTTQTFIVDISDVNDNAPVFNQTLYTMYVSENNVPTVLVGTVTAADADTGSNARVTYSLVLVNPTEQPPCSCISVNSENGDVFVLRPLDYEQVKQIEVLFLRVEVTVEDINDHAPVFPEEQVTVNIPEPGNPGSRFPLEGAQDLDIGSNSIQAYSISPENEYFSVFFGGQSEDEKYVELVLEKPLDREEQADMHFSLIAVDGGSPPRSGTIEILIFVLDVNDNSPVFTQRVYVGKVLENAPEGSVVLRVVATDLDAGPNGDISYQFSQAVSQTDSAFVIDPVSGEIKLSKPLDFETAERYELSVRATDGGGLSAICKVLVEVVDVNDNAPELVVSSLSNPLPENTLPGTVVALFNVKDRDTGANGKISCALEDQLSFSLRPTYKNYYELVTVSALDREDTARYILSVTAADAGSPPLTTTQTFTVDISDVNDNAPVFNQTLYVMYVRENNVPTVLVGAVSAADADTASNAKVTYSLVPALPTEQPPCSCISVNSENGDVFVLRPLDYEQVKQIEVLVSASDTGSPPLSANVTVRLVVVDENDNAPLVLYPSQDSNPPSSELVPMSAEAGYLVTKVVAVDADSGQNSWLSYHLLRATDPGLFVVGAQNGEVRLRRFVTERDAVKQKLIVLVRDNGQPPLSATVSLRVLLLSDFSDVRLPQNNLTVEDEGDSLTMYLIISLVFVSLLFLASMAAFITLKVCKRNGLKDGHVLYDAGNLQGGLADAAAVGTLPHPYCYEISLTTGSGNSEFKFLKPILPSLPPQHCTMGRGPDDEQDFPRGPITMEDVAPDNLGMLSAEQFNSLSFK